ncbi:Mfa1 family fimbria major subunit [Parabacteroides faecis]|uniref:Mfa1 family fimbria major subunit n=1 Tax=Parabacteroides faecis TaxID=1217282 RepID=UPI00216413E1|nr:Mfa1 family fimbria major subunit [Parabacteroides faecis]MCS2892345.1 Mfa1 family fimbria major subunit [Parabacteroides faecis]UVQ49015.1 Mfa1 family fimbria major subunit [Parabacteroides faecis]
MKKKNFYGLWVAALLMIAGGCSEELDGGDDINDGGDGKGEEAYVAVTISSPTTKVLTKVDPTGGEEGDDSDDGKPDERKIHDVTVILYGNKNGDSFKNVLDWNETVIAENKIIAVGYHKLDNPEVANPGENNHSSVTVQIESLIPNSLIDKEYGLICVANIGEELKEAISKESNDKIENVGQLGDYLVGSDIKDIIGDQKDCFVMSTHTMHVDNLGTSKVSINKGNNESNPAPSVAFIERLAAKIEVEDTNGNNGYTITDTGADSGNEIGKVFLKNFTIVNQLQAGTYLLKRVTEETEELDILSKDKDIYIGDETPTSGGSATNFVIDPWTRGKDGSFDKIVQAQDKYNTTTKDIDYASLYKNSFTSQKAQGASDKLYGNFFDETNRNNYQSFDNDEPVYTMENTTSKEKQLNGYSTGAIFEGVYVPKSWYVMSSGDSYKLNEQPTANDNYDSNKEATYYVYNTKVYNSLWAVFADWFDANVERMLDQSDDKDQTYKHYMELFKTKGLVSTDKDQLKGIEESDPTGYLKATLKSQLSFSDYESNLNDIGPTLFKNGISAYPDGKNYYKYWIRHSNNDNPDVMGVMEFAIVRNNIYNLQVNKVSGMGESPFKPTEPDDPDEGQEHYISVAIYVKHWVVRNNDIEL